MASQDSEAEDERSGQIHTGRWSKDEHQAFLVGLQKFGREWKKVASTIRTRTSAQIRSHAQKYFAKASSGKGDRGKRSRRSKLVAKVADCFRALVQRRMALAERPHPNRPSELGHDPRFAPASVPGPGSTHPGEARAPEGPATAAARNAPGLSSSSRVGRENLSDEELLALSVLCSPTVSLGSSHAAPQETAKEAPDPANPDTANDLKRAASSEASYEVRASNSALKRQRNNGAEA
mmetsp:Transcript_23013/g.51895  ORF Transcript_23013/g.51895 Transcript_23013/m.51895 type:complete len:236 (+) Transcript_23013:213-920(+)